MSAARKWWFLPVMYSVALMSYLTSMNVGQVVADNGPHGVFSPETDACGSCHQGHTGRTARLLVDPVPDLCISCHGPEGSGADTNVIDGIYLARDADSESPAEGVMNRGLRGGGFHWALMDTDGNSMTVAGVRPTTSFHTYDNAAGMAWGQGPTGSGPGTAGFPLSCTTCHDPHGSGSYRILRPSPNNAGTGTEVAVTDELFKLYTVADEGNDYVGEDYGSRGLELAAWCSQCHERYLAPSGSGHTDSGDPIFAFRHESIEVNCMLCHVAHGTAATMSGPAGDVAWPNGASWPDENARSSLLRGDDRSICKRCHDD